MLSSYESEITFSGGQFERDRIEALEKIVAEHKAMVDRLEGMLSEAPASKQAAAMDTAETSGELRRLQVDVEKLGNELRKVREEKADLEYEMERRSMRGDYDPRETKVLHFKNNPMSQAVEERDRDWEELQKENDALKARVQLLEEGQTQDLTMMVGRKVDETASSQEVRGEENSC